MNASVSIDRDFERESHRIDQLVWDAMALRAGESVLFCGLANNLEWIKRAAAIDVAVSVITDDNVALRDYTGLPVTLVRGSTAMMPVRDESFDATIAFHYLHEVDPFFHTNIVAELARVGKRCVIVEPAPPNEPLGLRIASMYARAKRELGQFETYHHIDYWRKLVALVKPDISSQTFTFMRTPPADAVRDTVALIIDTMAAEQAPKSYIKELRALAARPNAKLLPQARYVIVGTSKGEMVQTTSTTSFRDRPLDEPRPLAAAKPFVPPSVVRTKPSARPQAQTPASTVYSSPAIEAEFPAVIPRAEKSAGATPKASQIARNAFGLTAGGNNGQSSAPLGNAEDPDAFGMPQHTGAATPEEFGWAWDAPDQPTGA